MISAGILREDGANQQMPQPCHRLEAQAGVKAEDPEDFWPLPVRGLQMAVEDYMHIIVPHQKIEVNRLIENQPDNNPQPEYWAVFFYVDTSLLHAIASLAGNGWFVELQASRQVLYYIQCWYCLHVFQLDRSTACGGRPWPG